MKDAEANAEADKKRKEEVDLRNATKLSLRLKRQSKKLEGKGLMQNVTQLAGLDDLKKAQESGNLEEMKAKLEALERKAQVLAVKLYEQAAATSTSRS